MTRIGPRESNDIDAIDMEQRTVKALHPDAEVMTRQGLPYFLGISGATAGATGLAMHLVVIPPGGRATPHSHVGYETGIYVLEGRVCTRWGARLEHETVSEPGDFLFIPPGVPHEAINLSTTAPARAVVARNDAAEQDKVEPFVPSSDRRRDHVPKHVAMLAIRPATIADADAVWSIFQAVVATGDTYAFDPATSRDDALAYWFHASGHCYVAESDGNIVGTYVLKPNQPGLGSHVANAAFMVSPAARRQGVGRAMGEHCLAEARRLGFRAMQFNLVIATNDAAVRLWQQLGFTIAGVLPGAFRHATKGHVDAYVMYRSLCAP